MLLAKNRVGFKMLAVVVALALVMPMVMMPVGAAQAGENVKETNIGVTVSGSLPQEVIDVINSEGAEIKIMENGTPVIVVKVEKKEDDEEIYYIPLTLPSTAEVKNKADGSKTAVEVDGNYFLIPVVEDDEIEIERVCISDFEVKEIKDNGQLVLASEVNPLKKILLILGGAVFGYLVGEVIDEVRNRATFTSRDGPITIWNTRDAVFHFKKLPPQVLDGFWVNVRAFDVDRHETVNVYFLSGNTTLRLGTLNTGASDTRRWTTLRSNQLGPKFYALIKNNGEFQVKFDKTTLGTVRIDWFRVGLSW